MGAGKVKRVWLDAGSTTVEGRKSRDCSSRPAFGGQSNRSRMASTLGRATTAYSPAPDTAMGTGRKVEGRRARVPNIPALPTGRF